LPKKKAYELNRHFQDNWAMKLLLAEFVLSFNGRIKFKCNARFALKLKVDISFWFQSWIFYGNMLIIVKLGSHAKGKCGGSLFPKNKLSCGQWKGVYF
jgi:hypothetical protein